MDYNRLIGKTIDKHKIEELLGAGGFSYAFKVRNILDDQIKVFKILREDKFGKFFERSIHEGRVLEELADIEGVPDSYFPKMFNQHSIRSHYLALEYIPGRNLQNMIDSGESKQLSEREKIKMLYELAVTLEQVHQKGIIHRDIKPSNVVVSTVREGKNKFYDVHLIDFFLANYLNKENPPIVYKDKVFGTIGFIAPESRLKQDDQIKFGMEENEKTDIYAFGATAFALINDLADKEEVATQTRILQSVHESGKGKQTLVSQSNYLSVFKRLFIETTKYEQKERLNDSEVISELERLIEKKWIMRRLMRFFRRKKKKGK